MLPVNSAERLAKNPFMAICQILSWQLDELIRKYPHQIQDTLASHNQQIESRKRLLEFFTAEYENSIKPVQIQLEGGKV